MLILSAGILSVCTATAQPAAQYSPDSVTTALWHFNETSGISVSDTAVGLNGTAYGTTIVPGRFGNARSFNGAGDYVLVPSNTAFNLDSTSFTIDLWFKSTSQDNLVILRRGLAPDPGFMIALSNGHVTAMIGNREDSSWPDEIIYVTSTANYADGAWHVATMVRDRSVKKLFLYVDGVPACAPAVDNFTIPLNSTDPLTIGRWESPVYPYYFNGAIDEIRISKTVRAKSSQPFIAVQPSVLNFGWVRAHASDTLSLTIRNLGTGDSLRITSLATGNPLFGAPTGPIVIPAGGTATVPVWYSPVIGKAIGDTTVMRIGSNDSVSGQPGILMYGFGYTPVLPASPFTADSSTRGLWHFDEASGPIVRDTAVGNDGTAFGTTIIPGVFGNARTFNGTSDYVTVPSNTLFDFDTSGFRIDVWFKSSQAAGIILRRGLAPVPGFMISLFQDGRVVGMFGNRSDSYYPDELLSDTSVASYNDNAWHFVSMVRDRNVRRLFLYVDGILAGTPAVDNFILPLNSTRPLTFGRWEADFNPGWFTGSIDEVRISSPKIVRWPVRIQAQPGRLDFGTVRVGSQDTLGVLITNAGYRDSLRIQSLSSGNARFSVPAGPFVIAPGSSQSIPVVYAPTLSQADSGAITIANSDPSSPSLVITVTGKGFALLDNPTILSITQIAYNQARIVWVRSRLDTAIANSVTQYSIWHRGPFTAGASPAVNNGQARPDSVIPPGTVWEFIQTVPAIGVDMYAYTMTINYLTSPPWEVYEVVAQTKNFSVYVSPPDSMRGLNVTGTTGSPAPQVPHELTLRQNYPNPFNPSTTIRYGVPVRSPVSLVVYNALGQAVATLVDTEQEPGYYEVRFDGMNLASGVYFCRLKAGDSIRTNKILLLR